MPVMPEVGWSSLSKERGRQVLLADTRGREKYEVGLITFTLTSVE